MTEEVRAYGSLPWLAGFQRSAAEERLGHAYLLVGPRHAGKGRVAMELARLAASGGHQGDCSCAVCRLLREGQHPDVVAIDLSAEKYGIEQVRSWLLDLSKPPAQAKRRVYVVQDVELLSIPALNALLRSVEEPVAATVFLFTTSQTGLVPKTLLSRCQRLRMLPVSPADLALWLQQRGVFADQQPKDLGLRSMGFPQLALYWLKRHEHDGVRKAQADALEAWRQPNLAMMLVLGSTWEKDAEVFLQELEFVLKHAVVADQDAGRALAGLRALNEAKRALRGHAQPRLLIERCLFMLTA